jgi:hypothetical protein
MIRSPIANPPLGLPLFADCSDTAKVPVGTITPGFDDTNSRQDEYIYLSCPANIVPGDEVTYTTAYVATEVAAGSGQATAINTPTVGQFTWFRLKRRGVIA